MGLAQPKIRTKMSQDPNNTSWGNGMLPCRAKWLLLLVARCFSVV